MTQAIEIRRAQTPRDLAVAADLFQEYVATLSVGLGYQDFDTELANLPGKYAPPLGTLLLAFGDDGAPLGCGALRPLAEPGCCEMKRLYLRPAARGLGAGRALAEAIVEAARIAGYREIRLDTLSEMNTALALYQRMGFRPIAPYYGPTPDGTIFLGLTL